MTNTKKRGLKALIVLGAVLLGLVLLWLFLQFIFPHFSSPFRPDYPKVDLSPILAQEELTEEDYRTLFAQTGLGPAAIDDLRDRGEEGIRQILDTQAVFFDPPGNAPCIDLGITTREHRFQTPDGRLLYAAPLAPLREGDVLVSLSTHTAGWTHGHAGLVIDPEGPISLESVVLGSLSNTMDANHWRAYTTLAVVRPKSDDATRHQVTQFAMEHLYRVPYNLLSGIFGEKFQPVDGPHDAQCSYLPWYAWMAYGLDLDSNGGPIVAPEDLIYSDQVEIVQVYGLDPAQMPLSFDG